MLIQEVILENFMSYEYARIPLKPGVNVVCGPNGSGKSSILLGISVALGQSYTERSKKLSDLIRWGKDIGRVTLVLDNSRRGGHRPVPKINKDQIFLSRVLRRDGKYWFELENRSATKSDVVRLLSKFSVDPDNVLIIMHQNMAEQFIALSPQDKLKLIEEAVGIESYRRNVLDAQRKLNRILSQEESVGKLLESAEQTLNYWREQYDRYQQKKQLILKRRFLERELAWAEVSKRETIVLELDTQIRRRKEELGNIDEEIAACKEKLSLLRNRMETSKGKWEKLFEERLLLEKEKTKHEFSISTSERTLEEMQDWLKFNRERVSSLLRGIDLLENSLKEDANPGMLKDVLQDMGVSCEAIQDGLIRSVNLKIDNLKNLIESSKKRVEELDVQISNVMAEMRNLNSELEGLNDEVINEKVKQALLNYRRENITKDLENLERELKLSRVSLEAAFRSAEEMGPRIVTLRSSDEILDEMRVTDGRIAALADVSEDIERMYESYSKLYLELKEKARIVAENKEKTLKEIKARMDAWRTVIESLLEHINLEYKMILLRASATGFVRLLSEEDIEDAGIEICVGFRGAEDMPLNAYTHSGGERSTATMAFLLALQRHVQSPFRAVDEYDIHMDPKNRELMANLLVSSLSGMDTQYLVITPNRMFFEGRNVHIITVQNVEGASTIREVL